MAPQVKLTRGNTYLDLTAAPYGVGMDFTPPAINPAYNISAGTSANRTGGGKLISGRYNNRTFEFSVRIMATSITGTHSAARAIASFLKAQSAEPLYLEYRENTDIPVPLWGQLGAPLRYEIVAGDVSSPDEKYTITTGRGWFSTVTLEVKPLALGSRQKLANASGGVFEDNYGMTDGTARGLAMFREVTNKITNPVFGASTYTTGWTAGSSLIVSKNTDLRYTLPGLMQSVLITSRATTNNTFIQSLTAGNTNPHAFSAYIIMPDGGTPTEDDLTIYYGASRQTSFYNINGPLWLAYVDDYNATATAVDTGIIVKNGRSVYLLGYQCEELTYHTNLVHGDLLGCSWTGTVHTSTSTRAQPVIQIPREDNICSLAEGAVSMVVKSGLDSSFLALDQSHWGLFSSGFGSNGLAAWRESTNERIYFTDGTNTIDTGSSVVWAANEVKYFTYVWGPSGLRIYIDGALVATGATYTPASAADQLFVLIGYASPINGTIIGFDIYGVELTAGQVSTLYTNQLATVNAGRRVSYIPYIYTGDGVGDIYNHDDSGAGHDNWAVLAGIPGSAPAQFTHYFASSTTTKTAYWLGGYSIPLGPFDLPTAQWYEDESGTVDANSSGGEYETDGTSPFNYGVTMPRNIASQYSFFMRMGGSGAGTITVTPYLQSGTGVITGTPKACSVSTTQTLYYIGTMALDNDRDFDTDFFRPVDNVSWIFHGEYSSISSRVDFVMVIPNHIVKIDQGVNNAIGASQDYISYDGKKSYLFTSAGALQAKIPILGDELEIVPDRLNFLWVVIGDHGEAHVVNDYINLVTYIDPRYTLL